MINPSITRLTKRQYRSFHSDSAAYSPSELGLKATEIAFKQIIFSKGGGMGFNNNYIGRCIGICGAVLGLLFMSATVYAEDAPGAIPPLEERLLLCGGCHNPDGNSIIPENPKLAGLDAKYIARQLADFKSGKRTSPIMSTIIPMVDEKSSRRWPVISTNKNA